AEQFVTLGSLRATSGIGFSCLVDVVGRRSNRQHLADRLDSVLTSVEIDEGDHHLGRRSSSASAKYADAFRRISLARRNSLFSRSSSLSHSFSTLETPGFSPASRSAWRIQFRSVSPEQPIFSAMEVMAAHWDGYSPACSLTSRTVRSLTSAEYLVAFDMTPTSQVLEPPAIPGRFTGEFPALPVEPGPDRLLDADPGVVRQLLDWWR